MSRVWADGDYQQKSDLLVALAIADFSNDDGFAWPSIDTLAKKSRCCQRSVQNIIARLVRTGKLEVRYGAGPYGTNIYRVIVGGGANPAPPQRLVQPLHPSPRKLAYKQMHPIRQ